jgi:hypothetical protein
VLPMLDAGHDLPLYRAVAGKLVVIITRGGRICLFSSLRSSRLAACLLRRRCPSRSKERSWPRNRGDLANVCDGPGCLDSFRGGIS